MTTLINMHMDAEESKEMMEPKASDAPKYPWGLQIHLDDKAMEKLGLMELKVGSEVTIVAKATCSSCSSYQQQDGDAESSCDLQITDMSVDAGSDPTSMLYNGK